MKLSTKQIKEGWRIVKFGDMADQISKRVNPIAEDSKRYIGLEHLDSGSVRISRWGTEIILKGQKLEMKKGDILFAKRNAYLKRVAVAPFDGIFSAHGMILRAKGDFIISEFLPFFMQSDMFMERAVAISEGSLSPTIKWKALARQKFSLPPRKRQEEMLEIFEKIEKTLFEYDNVINKSSIFLEKFIRFSIFDTNKNDDFIALSSLVKEIRKHFNPDKNTSDIPYVGFEHIDSDSTQIADHGTSLDVHSNKLFFERGDVLYGKIRPYLKKTALADFKGICSSDIIVLRPLKEDWAKSISLIMKSDYFVNLAMSTVSGSKMPRAHWETLAKAKVNKTSLEDKNFNMALQNILQTFNSITISKTKNILIKKKITAQFLGDAP